MILLPQHKGKEAEVTLQQMAGWVFESHLWKKDSKLSRKLFPATCQWCGKKSEHDITTCIEKGLSIELCKENPYLKNMLPELELKT